MKLELAFNFKPFYCYFVYFHNDDIQEENRNIPVCMYVCKDM
jgi:hypothetical protein